MNLLNDWQEISFEEFKKINKEIGNAIRDMRWSNLIDRNKLPIKIKMYLHKYTLMVEDGKYYKK